MSNTVPGIEETGVGWKSLLEKKNVELHLLINAINIDLGIYYW